MIIVSLQQHISISTLATHQSSLVELLGSKMCACSMKGPAAFGRPMSCDLTASCCQMRLCPCQLLLPAPKGAQPKMGHSAAEDHTVSEIYRLEVFISEHRGSLGSSLCSFLDNSIQDAAKPPPHCWRWVAHCQPGTLATTADLSCGKSAWRCCWTSKAVAATAERPDHSYGDRLVRCSK